jgi:CheY-like chemotaxis protein
MKKILIVDDEPALVKLVSLRLKSQGYEIVSASNGGEAIERAQAEKPDLIILDVLMPGMTGFDAMNKIRELGGTFIQVPIIILTAKHSMKKFFEHSSIYRFIAKPFDTEVLVQEINTALGVVSTTALPAKKTGESERSTGKAIVVAGLEDYIITKVIDFLKPFGFQVSRAHDGKEVIEMAQKANPSAVLIQYWEDVEKFNTPEIYKHYLETFTGTAVPFIVFCKSNVLMEAMKVFPKRWIVYYDQSQELTEKMGNLLKNELKLL